MEALLKMDLARWILYTIGGVGATGIGALVLLQIYCTLSKKKLHRYLKENNGELLKKSKVLSLIFEDYEACTKTNNEMINTQAIIEKHFYRQKILIFPMFWIEKISRQAGSIAVVLGLLGTFTGLISSLWSIRTSLDAMLTNYAPENLEQFLSLSKEMITALSAPLSGMWYAFATSVAGLACSISLQLLGIIFTTEERKNHFFTELEEYLDNTYYYVLKPRNNMELAVDGIRTGVAEGINKFGDEIQKTAQSIAGTMEMVSSTFKELQSFAQNLGEVGRTIEQYKSVIKESLSEFRGVTEAHTVEVQKGNDNMISMMEKIQALEMSQLQVLQQVSSILESTSPRIVAETMDQETKEGQTYEEIEHIGLPEEEEQEIVEDIQTFTQDIEESMSAEEVAVTLEQPVMLEAEQQQLESEDQDVEVIEEDIEALLSQLEVEEESSGSTENSSEILELNEDQQEIYKEAAEMTNEDLEKLLRELEQSGDEDTGTQIPELGAAEILPEDEQAEEIQLPVSNLDEMVTEDDLEALMLQLDEQGISEDKLTTDEVAAAGEEQQTEPVRIEESVDPNKMMMPDDIERLIQQMSGKG